MRRRTGENPETTTFINYITDSCYSNWSARFKLLVFRQLALAHRRPGHNTARGPFEVCRDGIFRPLPPLGRFPVGWRSSSSTGAGSALNIAGCLSGSHIGPATTGRRCHLSWIRDVQGVGARRGISSTEAAGFC
jgi:hypothetical protein